MGIGDKIAGRVKKAAGDLTDNERLREDGTLQERKAEAEAELRREEARAEASELKAAEKRREVDRLDRAT